MGVLAPTLSELRRHGVGDDVVGAATTVVHGVQHDSRAVRPGDLFVAIPGASADGARFAPDAVARGAAAVLCERSLVLDVPQLLSRDARRDLGRAARVVYGDPSRELRVVGITGTNGKTTTAWLLEEVLASAGARPAMMGTVRMRLPGRDEPSAFTTPEADDIARFAREAVDRGATHLVMEVSSHGLSLHRVDDIHFAVAAFTNLTQDHLDFHGDMARYGEAKARLFTELGPEVSVVNVDDAFGATLADRVEGRVLRVSAAGVGEADYRVVGARMDASGIDAELVTPSGPRRFHSPLLGGHNLDNLLMALACAEAAGIAPERALAGLASARGAPGRLERIDDPRGVTLLVDYAHTPDALERALAALRPLTEGRLLVVFGCGGDRDRGKRPTMGRAAAEGADLAIVTSDNPRTEDPNAILADIEPGLLDAGAARIEAGALDDAAEGFVVEIDRARAIELAVHSARPGDVVLIAGKGHEDYQIVGTEKRRFDDREEARRAVATAGGGR